MLWTIQGNLNTKVRYIIQIRENESYRQAWLVFLELQSLEPLQWKTIYKIYIGLDFTCKWTEPRRSLLSYKGQKFILCLLQCNCTLLHCLGKTRLQERIPSPHQKHMKSVFKGIQKWNFTSKTGKYHHRWAIFRAQVQIETAIFSPNFS